MINLQLTVVLTATLCYTVRWLALLPAFVFAFLSSLAFSSTHELGNVIPGLLKKSLPSTKKCLISFKCSIELVSLPYIRIFPVIWPTIHFIMLQQFSWAFTVRWPVYFWYSWWQEWWLPPNWFIPFGWVVLLNLPSS